MNRLFPCSALGSPGASYKQGDVMITRHGKLKFDHRLFLTLLHETSTLPKTPLLFHEVDTSENCRRFALSLSTAFP